MIRVKRAYDPHAKEDGARFLVDRLWPRGIKKEALHMAAWCKQAAPSNELRRWFNHDPAKWKDFQRRYRAELTASPVAWQPLLEAAEQGDITFLYSAHDTEHNNAVALKAYLEKKLVGKKNQVLLPNSIRTVRKDHSAGVAATQAQRISRKDAKVKTHTNVAQSARTFGGDNNS